MTTAAEPTTPPPVPVAEKASFWEDLIDIFYQPRAVFERRRNASAWPPFLFVVIAIGVITFATYSTLEPAITADMQRVMAKSMAQNPQMTQEMADRTISMQATFGRYIAPLFLGILIAIVGLAAWLVSKMFSGREGAGQAIMITSYAYMPRVLGAIATGGMGLLMDAAKLTSMTVFSLGPAHFADSTTTSPLVMAVLQRLEIPLLWETVLLAIGVAVLGKISRGKATAFGILMWVLGGLWQFRTAFLQS